MKILLGLFAALLLGLLTGCLSYSPHSPNRILLPSNYEVYTYNNSVTSQPSSQYKKVILPTNTDFKGTPGCYVACYSRDKTHSAYSIESNINTYVIGQVRLPGRYIGRECIVNYPLDANFYCNFRIRKCQGNCWAGGDTGGWFGLKTVNRSWELR